MSRSGQNNICGVSAQSWAAISLFLQFINRNDFDSIHLEAQDSEDFDLLFHSNYKIICESKAWAKPFNFSHLKNVLKSLLKKRIPEDNDQILIICKTVNKELERTISNLPHYPSGFANFFKKKGFTEELIAHLPKVKIWRATPEHNERITYELFSDVIGFWLSENRMREIVSDIILQKIYKGSANGGKYSKRELFADLNSIKRQIVVSGGIFDRERRKNEKILKELLRALEDDKDYIWAPDIKSQLSAQPDLLAFVFGRIQNNKYESLEKWDELWSLNKISAFSFRIFKIFANNLHTPENRKYVINYINQNVGKLRGHYRVDFFFVEVAEILKKILAIGEELTESIFHIIKALFKGLEEEQLFDPQYKDLSYEKEKISDLLTNLFNITTPENKERIYKYILEEFDLVEDSSDSDIHSSLQAHNIVQAHITSFVEKKHFEDKFDELAKAFCRQYSDLYKKWGMTFKGWEEMGSAGSFWGHAYVVSDRRFVTSVLTPVLYEYYVHDRGKAWRFISKRCISQESKVSARSPDFLNRAALPIVLEQYKSSNNKIKQLAYKILKDLILQRKGIPHKSELIFQDIRGDGFTDEQRWELVSISLSKYKIPSSPFIEQIVTGLAKEGHPDAKRTLFGWFSNSEYFKRPRILDYSIPNIKAIIDRDLDFAILLFEAFLKNEEFIHRKDQFETYDAAGVLYNILEKDYKKGLKLLKHLSEKDSPTLSEQILLSYGFCKNGNNSENQESKFFLKRIYKNYVHPNLSKFSNPKFLTSSHARNAFLQFAQKLALKELIEETLTIVRAFLNDPDPYMPGQDPEDPEVKCNEYKRIIEGREPHTITSVRGWCAWVLASCPAVPSRLFIPQIIEMTKVLLKDPNWYVKHMACFSLGHLAGNRLTVMPPKKKHLFFDDDKIKALTMAKDIERSAFSILGELSGATPNVQKALGRSVMSLFDHIHALNQKDSENFLALLVKCVPSVQAKAAPFLIYLAEFRKKSYKNWPWYAQALYDDLAEFDDSKFKTALMDMVTNGASEIRSQLVWQFGALVREYKDKLDEHFLLAMKYLDLASENYDSSVFRSIYLFINDFIDSHFDQCFELWKKCLNTERQFLVQGNHGQFTAHYGNGEILLKILKEKGEEDFLAWLDFLCSFPETVELGNIRPAIQALVGVSQKNNQQVAKIFDKLINDRKESSYHDLQETWNAQQSNFGR